MRNYRSMPCKLSGSHLSLDYRVIFSYGYDATKEQTRKLYSLSEHEILYVMNTVCILYQTDTKQQRFYTKHQNPITW